MKTFILGMTLASFLSQTASAANLTQIHDQLRTDLPNSTSKSTLKDAGIILAEGISIVGINRYIPRLDQKAIAAKVAELETLKAEKTTEDVINEITALERNTSNYVSIESQSALNESTQLGGLTRKARIEISNLNEESRVLTQNISQLNRSIDLLDGSVTQLNEEIRQTLNSVSSYESLVLDANNNGVIDLSERGSAKLKDNVQQFISNKETAQKQLTLQLESQRENLKNLTVRNQQIQSRISSLVNDISLRTHTVLREDVQAKIDQLKSLPTVDKKIKEARIRGLEKQISVLAQKGLRGLGVKTVRVLSSATGVLLLADFTARGYLTLSLNKDAGIVAALEIAAPACESVETCMVTIEKVQQGVDFLIENASVITK